LQNKNASTPSTRLLPGPQREFSQLKPANTLNPKTPYPRPDRPRPPFLGFLFCPGLLLERTEHQETRPAPNAFLGENLKENIGEPKEAVSKHRDRAAAAVSNNRVNEA
jgi:hypothetical protein